MEQVKNQTVYTSVSIQNSGPQEEGGIRRNEEKRRGKRKETANVRSTPLLEKIVMVMN